MAPSPNASPSLSQIGVYGLSVATDLDLIPHFPSRSGSPDLRVVASDTSVDLAHQNLLFSSPTREPNAAPAVRLYRKSDRFVFRFAGVAEFHVGEEHIEYILHDGTFAYALELWLLGTVLAFWLEWQGIPALHASAVATEDGTVGFLASKQGGKSTLAASLLQRGHCLLTDDLLPLDVQDPHVQGRPGYPQMRMWPDHARHFVDDPHALRRANPYTEKRRVPVGPKGFGTFCDEARTLKTLYLPERTDDASVQIQPVGPMNAVQAVLRNSFLPRLVEAVGWQASRLNMLSRLVEQVPVRRLTYPEGVGHLSRITDAILDAEP